jgi:hypothetical protein
MNMHKRRELITKYKELWDKFVEVNTSSRFLGEVLRRTCGFNPECGDQIEQFPILAIPVTELERPNNYIVAKRDDLAVFGTDCGKTPEAYKVFGEKGIIEFLVGFKVDFVFGCLRNDEDVDIAHVGIPLGALAFQAGSRVGEAFAYVVNEYGGSLRYEDYQYWCVFESE